MKRSWLKNEQPKTRKYFFREIRDPVRCEPAERNGAVQRSTPGGATHGRAISVGHPGCRTLRFFSAGPPRRRRHGRAVRPDARRAVLSRERSPRSTVLARIARAAARPVKPASQLCQDPPEPFCCWKVYKGGWSTTFSFGRNTARPWVIMVSPREVKQFL